MTELNKKEDRVIRLYGFETEGEMIGFKLLDQMHIDSNILFSGTKSELLNQSEEWCKEIIESGTKWTHALFGSTERKKKAYRDYSVTGFSSLKGAKRLPFRTAKESLKSAIELEPGNYFIITREEK